MKRCQPEPTDSAAPSSRISTIIEVRPELLVGGRVDRWLWRAQQIDQAQRRDGLGRQVDGVQIPQGGLHVRLAQPFAHQRCAARQTSMHTVIVRREPNAAELHGKRIDPRHPRIDEGSPV